jgi:hypothetical protein
MVPMRKEFRQDERNEQDPIGSSKLCVSPANASRPIAGLELGKATRPARILADF